MKNTNVLAYIGAILDGKKIKVLLFFLLIALFTGFILAQETPPSLSIKQMSYVKEVKSSGLEKQLFLNINSYKNGTDLIIEADINTTVFNFLKNTYTNWGSYSNEIKKQKCQVLEPYIQEDKPNFDCTIPAHRTLLKSNLNGYIEKGWELYKNGLSRGFIEANKTNIKITISNITDRDRIRLGNNTIVREYQNVNTVSYESSWFSVNSTLFINLSNEWNHTSSGLFVFPVKKKFGANVSGYTADQQFKYNILSSLPIQVGNGLYTYYISRQTPTKCGSVDCFNEEQHKFDFSDICKERRNMTIINITEDEIDGGILFDPQCEFTLKDNSLDIIFFAEYNSTSGIISVDPSITITDVSVSASILTNITTEDNFTHLTIGDNTIDFINSSNLVLYMPFDVNISTTTVYDYSSNDNDGTINGDAHYVTSGYFGGGFEFDGSGDDIEIPDSPLFGDGTMTEITVSAWVFVKKWSDGPRIVHKNGAWALDLYSTDEFQFFLYPFKLGERALTSGNFVADQWYHVVGTYNSTSILVYVNGNLEATDLEPDGAIVNSADNLFIGLDEDGSSFPFNGTLDEIMVINRSLTATEISNLYNNQSSRFFSTGTQEFQNNDITSGTFVNITINSSTNFGSSINVTLGDKSSTGYDFGSEFAFTNNFANDIPLGTPNNFSLKFTFYAGNSTESFISPTLENNINITSFGDADAIDEGNFSHLKLTGAAPYDSLVFYMPFDGDVEDTEGITTYDFTKNSNDGTASGNVVVNSTNCVYGACAHFDGTGDFINAGTDASLNVTGIITISAWIYPQADVEMTILGKQGKQGYWVVTLPSGQIGGWFGTSGRTNSNTGLYTLDNWSLVTFVFNSSNYINFYVNGVFDKANSYSTSPGSYPNDPLDIGTDPRDETSHFFTGMMDEIMIFNTALNAQQVLDIYNNQSTRFFPKGIKEFKNNDETSGTFVNVTINSTTNLGSSINVSLGNVSGTTYDFGSEFAFTNNLASDIPLGTPTNFSLKFILNVGNDTNPFMSPILQNNINITSFGVATSGTAFIVNVSQSFTSTSNNEKTQGRIRENTLSLIITSLIDKLYSGFIEITQNFSITSIIEKVKTQFTSLTQNFSITSLIDKIKSQLTSVFQSFQITSTIDKIYGGLRDITQSFSITSLVDKIQNRFTSISQNFIITMLVNTVKTAGTGVTAFVQNVIQSFTTTFNIEKLYSGFRDIIQQFSVTSLVEKAKSQFTSISQNFSITSTLDKIKSQLTSVFQSFQTNSLVSRIYGGLRDITQSFSITSLVDKLKSQFTSISQSFSITKSVSTLFASGFDKFTELITQSFNFDSVVNKLSTFSRSILQSILLFFNFDRDQEVVVVGDNGLFPLTIKQSDLDIICGLSNEFLLSSMIDGELVIDPIKLNKHNKFLLGEKEILLSNIDLGNILQICPQASKSKMPKIIPYVLVLLVTGLIVLAVSYRNKKMVLMMLKKVNG